MEQRIKVLGRIKALRSTFVIIEPVTKAIATKTTYLEKTDDEWDIVTTPNAFDGYYVVAVSEDEREKLKKYDYVILEFVFA